MFIYGGIFGLSIVLLLVAAVLRIRARKIPAADLSFASFLELIAIVLVVVFVILLFRA